MNNINVIIIIFENKIKMNQLHPSLSADEKKYLEEECGLSAYKPHAPPNHADPDHPSYHMFSALIMGASLAGRWYAPKIGVTRWPFTISALLVPTFYFLAINHKEKRFAYSAESRRTFE